MPDPDTVPEEPDPDAVRMLQRLADAQRAAARARTARVDLIKQMYDDGIRPIDITRTLHAAASTLDLDPHEVDALGISESSVHYALSITGAKRARREH